MTRSTLDGENARLPVYPLRVLSVGEGCVCIVRLCSASYGGLGTHWTKDGSKLCLGEDCPRDRHKLAWHWKGYGSVEVYHQGANRWFPHCLEMTSNLELDFRGKWARGQVWEISRPKKIGKKHQPASAVLLEERDPNTFPPGLDLIPCLKHLYYAPEISLDLKNPMPARTLVVSSVGEAPQKKTEEAQEDRLEPKEIRRLLQEMRAKLGQQ